MSELGMEHCAETETFKIEYCADMTIEYKVISKYNQPVEIQLEDILIFGKPLSAYQESQFIKAYGEEELIQDIFKDIKGVL